MCEKRNLPKRTSVESPLQMYCNESVVALDATALDDFALLLKVLSMQLLLMLLLLVLVLWVLWFCG